jgi:hypothetical protein
MTRLLLAAVLIASSSNVLLCSAAALDARPPGAWLSAVVNLREHGAAGDGATDDTPAIVSAFSGVCAAGGGTIYLPAGVYIIDPASARIPICSHLDVRGPGTLKVKPEAGNYQCIFAPTPPTAAVDDITFAGLTVDQNTGSNTAGTIVGAAPRTHQDIWQIFAGTNLHFEDLHLYVSGVNPIDVNGPAVSGVFVERNYIVFQKRAGQPEFDNSAIYIHGDNFHVTGNTFVTAAADEARTAIEVHDGSGAVIGNTIAWFSIGMNLVNLRSASIASNSIREAGYGISLWADTRMDSVVIASNTLSLVQATRRTPSSWGIATTFTPGLYGDFSNLLITGNTVRFERETESRPISGSANFGIALQAPGNVSDVTIAGNQVVDAPVRGITVGVLDARYATSRVSVRDNRITDAGSNFTPGSADYSAAVAIQGNLSAVDVVRNRVDFSSRPFSGRFSFWSMETGYTFRDVIAAENITTAADGSPASGLTPSVVRARPPE